MLFEKIGTRSGILYEKWYKIRVCFEAAMARSQPRSPKVHPVLCVHIVPVLSKTGTTFLYADHCVNTFTKVEKFPISKCIP